MSAQSNKAACLAFLEKVYNEGRQEAIYEFVASDAVDHDVEPYALPYATTPELIASFVCLYHKAFPDLRVEIEDMLAEEDRVATRWRLRGTHAGPLMGIGATGKPVEVSGLRIDRFANGKVVETWGSWDVLGMLEQIGALPAMRRTAPPVLRSVAA